MTDRFSGNPSTVARAARPCKAIYALLALLLLISGCTSHGGILELEPAGGDQTLAQRFANAYVTQSGGGEYEIVLVDQVEFERQNPKKPLRPQPLAPTRQVMHLHLYWRPVTDQTRSPAAVNAAIDWYVLGSDAAEDVVLYEGAGIVTVEGSGRQRVITITEGTVQPRASRGAMQDPIGNSRISGTFTADVNRTRVRETLSEMRDMKAPGDPQAASGRGSIRP